MVKELVTIEMGSNTKVVLKMVKKMVKDYSLIHKVNNIKSYSNWVKLLTLKEISKKFKCIKYNESSKYSQSF